MSGNVTCPQCGETVGGIHEIWTASEFEDDLCTQCPKCFAAMDIVVRREPSFTAKLKKCRLCRRVPVGFLNEYCEQCANVLHKPLRAK